MANKYKFESKEVVLNHLVVDIIGKFVKSGYTAEHILGSFLDYKKGVKNSTYPLVESWRGVNGSDFLTCYCDYIAKEKKTDRRLVLECECGIDEGIVSERFFRSVKATDNILIVNPHPQFVQSLADQSSHITVTYTSDQYTEVMQRSKSKKGISYTIFGQLSPNTYNRILFFGQSMSTQQIVSALKQIKPLLIEDKDTIVYMQIPAKHIDGKHNRPVLREVLHSDYTVNQALLIDPDAAKGFDKKKLLLIMRNTSPSSTAEVVLQKIQLGERGASRYLSGNETRHISYDEFLSGVKTLRATYDILGRDTAVIKQRETAVQFKYSKEIENVWISSISTDKDVIRPKYAVYDTPSSEKKRTTKKAQGNKLYGHKQGPRMNSRNKAFAYALDFMLNDPKVVQVINDIVMRPYYHKSISLKSVWYLYNKEIQKLNLYDNTICEQMFCCAYNPESKLHNLIAGESTYSQICEAIKVYCTDNGLNNRQRERMLVQINLLWNVAVEKMHTATNPILDFHGEHVGANKTQELRNAMVLGSYGSKSISQLITNIQDRNSDPSLVVGFWLMLFLPLLAAEVCALCWKDFRKVTGEDYYQLSISIKFGATGTKSLPILSRWLARALPVIRMLEDILLKHKRSAQRLLMEQGRLDVSIDDCPLIHAPGDPTKPVLTRTLNAFVRQMLSTLEIPAHLLSVPKHDGTFDTTDINKKQRNFLRSNFEHNMIIHAKMNADEIAYMLGRTPVSVLAMHYISRRHSFSQKGLFLKMRKWEKHILGNSNDDISLYAQFTDNVIITVPERNGLYYEELTEEFRSSTKNRYKDEIPNIILPYFKGKKLSQCNLAFCKSVIKDIEKKGTRKSKGITKYSNESVERFRFYIERLIKVAAKRGHCENFLCYTDFRIKRVRLVVKKKKNENKQLRRFLTIGEICKIVKIIFVDYKQTGQRMALLLMLICGFRNKEACGLLFGDIEEIVDHPGCYVLLIYKTTEGTGHNYLMGHAFLNKHTNRDVYNNPDIQYKLYCVLCQRPFFPPFDSGCTRMEYKGNVMRIKGQTRATIAINQSGRYLIKAVGNHPDDPLSVSISTDNEEDISEHYTFSPSMASMPDEICLLQDYIDAYISTWNSIYGDEKMETGE